MSAQGFPKSFSCYKPYNHKVYGTICITPYNTVLLVCGKKTGKWSFPKGHMKRGERYIECAVRETLEETGIDLADRKPVAYHKLSVGEYFFFEVEEEIETGVVDTTEISEARWLCMEDLVKLPCNVDVNKFIERLRHV